MRGICICLDDCIHREPRGRQTSTRNLQNKCVIETKQLVSFFCICLLYVEWLLFSRFPCYLIFGQFYEYKTMLCVCRLLAQCFYQVGAGQKSLSDWACELIGALCHFCWLSFMFSLNVCSIQLYLTFEES